MIGIAILTVNRHMLDTYGQSPLQPYVKGGLVKLSEVKRAVVESNISTGIHLGLEDKDQGEAILGRPNNEINAVFDIRATDKDLMAEAFYDMLLASEVESLLVMRDQLVNEEILKRLK